MRSLLGERHNRHAHSAAHRSAIPHGTQPSGRPRTSPEPYVTINVDGPLQGIVTLTATDSPRVVVEATWGDPHNRDRISLTRSGEGEALILADCWANQLIDGHEPARVAIPVPPGRETARR